MQPTRTPFAGPSFLTNRISFRRCFHPVAPSPFDLSAHTALRKRQPESNMVLGELLFNTSIDSFTQPYVNKHRRLTLSGDKDNQGLPLRSAFGPLADRHRTQPSRVSISASTSERPRVKPYFTAITILYELPLILTRGGFPNRRGFDSVSQTMEFVMPIPLRDDFDAAQLRRARRGSRRTAARRAGSWLWLRFTTGRCARMRRRSVA
jgi:hypothetical protein